MKAGEKRWRPRLWTFMSLASALIVSLIIGAIVLTYHTSLASVYEDGLRRELTDALAQLRAEDFSDAAVREIRADGIRLLVVSDDAAHSILVQDAGGGRMDLAGIRDRGGGRSRKDPARADAEALAQMIEEELGSSEGSRFFMSPVGGGTDESSGKHQYLYLIGRADGRLFCLRLAVESTNTAVSIATRFATVVGAITWLVSVVALYFLSLRMTKPHRAIVRTAGQIAELDFSRRCQPAASRELNELSVSINRMSDRLQANVEGLRTANERLQEELAERIRQQQITTDLIANLSHDLKTPIAVISGYAEGLQEGVARTPEQRQTYYGMILKESEHMQELVYKLLAQSRLDSGEIPIEIEEFDLAELLDEVVGLFRREIDRLELRLEADYPHPIPVRTDYESIRQSVINYVQNAVLHVNNGRDVRIRVRIGEERVRLCVANSSAPIPPEEAERIWEKLYRGDPSRQRRQGEAGLGLSIVKGNMDRLGLPFGQENLDGMVEFWLEAPLDLQTTADAPPDRADSGSPD